jgi:hypothetical protein
VTIILENSRDEKNSIGSKFNELGLILHKLRSSSSSSTNKEASSFSLRNIIPQVSDE